MIREPVVCISSMNWEEHRTAKQQLMARLARQTPVLYCQRQLGLEHLVKHPQYILPALRGVCSRERTAADNLWLEHVPPLLPGRYYSHTVNRINQSIVAACVNRVLARRGWTKPLLWTYEPHSAPLVGSIDAAFTVYHCVELFSVASAGRKKRIMDEQEAELCRRADLVVCATKGIYDAKRPLNPDNTVLVYNGVDLAPFDALARQPRPVPEDLARVPRPRLGHVGMVNGKVDLDLLDRIASRHPEWHLALVGDVFYTDINPAAWSRLRARPNVHVLGMKPADDLPAYLQGLDVCLLAGRDTPWTRITRPLKCYEYLPSGKPIVSIGFPELEEFRPAVELCANDAEYEAAIERALAGRRRGSGEEQIELGRRQSWDLRLERILAEIAARRRT